MMRTYLMLALLIMSSSVLAADKSSPFSAVADESTPPATTEAQIPAVVTDAAKLLFKGETFKIAPSPLKEFYEVVVNAKDVLYLTTDGRHVVSGSIFEVKTRNNLTKIRHDELLEAFKPQRKQAIDSVPEKEMVVFAPEKETKHTINVFTDVDCGYCAKLHQEVPQLNKAGVKVRYLAFPRAGVGSKTYKTMVSVWCSEDQQQAMTDAKARRTVEEATCNHQIKEQYELGKRLGITGTPALVLSNGELIPGYRPARQLISMLKKMEK
ncbi:thioredoxin fold domain-containing protein [Candidatus Parabeggiatoa sp. HSG14]|uniref:thioredoxin fold domain-containing protein n=1 Tax=Candidatus Parabeggiatoa sp. HSG14 TaxID=3055593 RepID=UPI0025A84E15|nr:thioredoxin fold domain-containing protein [Thiotrichales bacterium HSG14]